MKSLKIERSWDNFFERVQNLSRSRRNSIETSCRQFDKFCTANYDKSLDEVIAYIKTLDKDEKEDSLIEILQDWVNQLTGILVVSTTRLRIVDVNRYLKYHRIGINTREIEFEQNLQEEPYAITLDEIHHILRVATWRKQGYYLALISTGARPAEILGLRKKDIRWNKEHKCYTAIIPAYLTKKKMSRTVRFSKEVEQYLNKFLRGKGDDDLIFCKNSNLVYARSNEGAMLRNYCERVGFTEKYETTGRHKINLYCFRAYFFTKALRRFGDDTAHAMIGHGAYLQQYQRRTLHEKIELWEDLEPDILIFDMSDKDKRIRRLEQENKTLASQVEEIKELKRRQQELEKILLKKESGEPTSQDGQVV